MKNLEAINIKEDSEKGYNQAAALNKNTFNHACINKLHLSVLGRHCIYDFFESPELPGQKYIEERSKKKIGPRAEWFEFNIKHASYKVFHFGFKW